MPSTDALKLRALSLLRSATGSPVATFHDDQWPAIEALVAERARLLVVQRTGWGKSMVYFVATKLLREAGAGPTLILSPLLALMRNQVEAAQRLGLRAITYNSAQTGTDEGRAAVREAVMRRQVDLLLVSPETLFSEHFRDNVIAHASFGLLVVDEAHCISDWGHDFRTDYRRIVTLLRQIPRGTPILATTATANDRVVRDVKTQLGQDLREFRGPLSRASLRLQTLALPTQPQRLAWLASHLPSISGSGIVYVRTKRDAVRVAEWLTSKGIKADAYYSGLKNEEGLDPRPGLEDRLLANTIKVLVATSALGMGFDKPDLGFVIHYQRPGSVVEYYQQVGRAGRGIDQAYGLLMSGDEDDEITRYFIERAHPPLAQVRDVLAVLDGASKPLTLTAIAQEVNLSENRIKSVLDILHALTPSPVHRTGISWQRTAVPYVHDAERVERLKQIRLAEQEEMKRYMMATRCLQQVLCEALDDPSASPCGRCAVCAGRPPLPTTYAEHLVHEAATFLRHRAYVIAPRKRWPGVHLAITGKTTIPEVLQAAEGRALGTWRDGAWGELTYTGKYVHAHFDDALVEAARALIAKTWAPQPAPAWVTCVPSRRRPALVRSFAERLAHVLGLPFRPCITQPCDVPEQKLMGNSTFRVQNIKDAFAVEATVPQGQAVLLVDDIVDSGWTFTVLAARLRQAGAGPVYPFALASASSSD